MPRIINLLPTGEQKVLKLQRIYRYVRVFSMLSIASYFILAIVLVGWRVTLENNLNNVDANIASVKQIINKQDNQKIQAEVLADNGMISDYNNFAAANPQWSRVLEGFAQLVPSNVVITSFNANTKTGKIDIAGIAATRDAEAVTLRNNLTGSPLFKNVNLPFENLQKPTNVNFSYTFYVNDNILSPTSQTNVSPE